MAENIAFLPFQESVMDELRTTEGMIFRDEIAKKLFLDIKFLLLDEFYAVRKEDKLKEFIDDCLEWSPETSSKVYKAALSKYPGIQERLTTVSVLYAKHLFTRTIAEQKISMKKPHVNSFLQGMFQRMCKVHQVSNGSFFEMDPLKQDFVIRDIFRQTLGADCIQVIVEEEPPVVLKEEVPLSEGREMFFDEKTIGPDDSISRVMENMKSSRTVVSSLSHTSRTSSYKKPQEIKRVKIEEE